MATDLRDIYGRPLTDLRISVTDRCNFRCGFCMPAEREYEFLPREEVLSYEELARLARLFAERGVRKIRITGGEPLLRRDLTTLVEMLASIPGVEDLALTTNGTLLGARASSLAAAGLDRVTVSVHSLDSATFVRLTGGRGDLRRTLSGIAAAREAGLAPIKVNCTVVRGVNDDEVVELARFFKGSGVVPRFIEYMDVGTVNDWHPERVVTAREIVERIDRELPLREVRRRRPSDPARRYAYLDGEGELGVIASISEPFCGDCSRARLTAEGLFFTCLFGSSGEDLKAMLRAGASDEEIGERLEATWRRRDDRYSEERENSRRHASELVQIGPVEMFRIGG